MASAKMKITVLPCRSVVIDGQRRGPGETVTVSAADAKALIAEGYAEKA